MSVISKPGTEIRIHVAPFNFGTMGEKVLKPLEEASEIRGAYQYSDRYEVLYEICDTIQASVNLAVALGFKETEINGTMAKVTLRNYDRGRYDKENLI